MTVETAARTLPTADRRLTPAKLAHVVLRSKNYDAAKAWYERVLGARVTFDAGHMCFLTYDDEHHRIALVRAPASTPDRAPGGLGVDHIAFTFGDLGSLLQTWRRLKTVEGIEPVTCINHGPTTSFYYVDPDGQRVELQVDNFADEAEAQAFSASGVFKQNPYGVLFDPERLLERWLAGAEEPELLKQDAAPDYAATEAMLKAFSRRQ
jgi:catechol 2,3-dioxygenase-like lactoylglutathione lyase family enzyme